MASFNQFKGNTTATGTLDAVRTWGHRVTPSEDYTLRRLAWFHITGTADMPERLTVWRVSDGVKLRDLTVSTAQADPTGWKLVDADELVLAGGVQYSVQIVWPVGRIGRYWTAVPTPEAPLVRTSVSHHYHGTGNVLANEGQSNGAYITIDFDDDLWSGPTPSAPPPTAEPDPGTTNPGGSLAWWLSRDTNNADSAPKATLEALTDGNTGLAAAHLERQALAAIIGSTGSAGTATVMGRLAALALTAATILQNTDAGLSILTNLQLLLNPGDETWEQVNDRIIALHQQFTKLDNRANASLGDVGWTNTGGGGGQGPFIVNVPADRYVLEITSVGDERPLNTYTGVDMYFKAGWWSPLDGDLAHERRFIDFRHQVLMVPGQRMHGVFIWLQPDITATLEAWVRD